MSILELVLIAVAAFVVLGGLLVLAMGLMAGGRRREALEQDLLPPGKIEGVISLTGLPPHRGLILNLVLYEVGGPDAPPPYDGRPPAEAAKDLVNVLDDVNVDVESTVAVREQKFTLEHPTGWFYVEVRAVLFRKRGENLIAQVEQFFYSKRPLRIRETGNTPMTYPVAWPADSESRTKKFGVARPDMPPLPEPPA